MAEELPTNESNKFPSTNVFVTQIHDRDEEALFTKPTNVIKEQFNSNNLLQTGLNTLQQTLVVKKESEMAKLDQELAVKRDEFQYRMDQCSRKKLELQRRQQGIMIQVEKFDQFVKENEAKRKRALQKYQLENKIKLAKEEELAKLKETLASIKEKHQQLQTKVKAYKKYEDYLVKVINTLPPDYIKASDNPLYGLMLRHKTLHETNNDLMIQMDTKLDEIKELRHKLDDLKHEHNKRLLNMNSRLSELHHDQERVHEEAQRLEQEFRYRQNDMRHQVESFGLTLRAVDNITEKCLKRYESNESMTDKREKLNKIEVEQKFKIIKEYIQDMQDILKLVEIGSEDSPKKK